MATTRQEEFELYLQKRVREIYADRSTLHEACRYAMAGTGKRMRPSLLILCSDLCGLKQIRDIFEVALAIEFIHTYSLVHDDLPAMDNDDFRRGRPSTHKVYGEDIGILVGDALLTDAFYLLSQNPKAAQTVKLLSWAAGSNGMVLGQTLDIKNVKGCKLNADELKKIHELKTGRLFAASCGIGAIYADCSEQDVADFITAGQKIGLAFQIQDDLLDDSKLTGKSSGKDLAQEKTTFVSLYKRSELEEILNDLMREIEQHFLKYAPQTHEIFRLLSKMRSRST